VDAKKEGNSNYKKKREWENKTTDQNRYRQLLVKGIKHVILITFI